MNSPISENSSSDLIIAIESKYLRLTLLLWPDHYDSKRWFSQVPFSFDYYFKITSNPQQQTNFDDKKNCQRLSFRSAAACTQALALLREHWTDTL